MRILQVTYRFPSETSPGGGISQYVKNFSTELSKRGHNLLVFSTGGRNKKVKTTYIQKGRYADIELAQLINSPYEYDNYHNPLGECNNAKIENLFKDFLEEVCPDIVHFQSLNGLCGSLIEIACSFKIHSVVSLHNYWYICPRVELFKPLGKICDGPEASMDCADCAWVTNAYKVLETKISWVFDRLPISLDLLCRKKMGSLFKQRKANISIENLYRFRMGYMKCLLAEKVDSIIAVSSFVKRRYIKFGISPEKIQVISIGTIASAWYDFSLDRFSKDYSKNKIAFGYIGPLRYIKGPHVLLKAFRRLNSDKARLIFWGGHATPTQAKLLKKLSQGLDVKFSGIYNFSDLPNILKTIDVIIVPPLWHDNAPQVVFEAQALRIPIIASRIGGIPDFVEDGKNGLLFEPGNVDELKDKMLSIIRNPLILNRMRKNIPKPKSMEEHAEEMERLYLNLRHSKTHEGIK